MTLYAKIYPVLKPALMCIDAETAHRLSIKALAALPAPPQPANDPSLKVTLWDRQFPNPVGLAAGFDKNAEVVGPMLGLGFGFVEAGTVTPKPQDGNPRPRVFRAPAHGAVINRMGFPNIGMAGFRHNIERFLEERPRPAGIVGINIGMNKDQTDPARDYCALVRALGPFADYLTVNISSPNTPGLRNLQEPEAFRELIGQIKTERDKTCGTSMPPPLLVKLAPDLTEDQQQSLATAALECGLDGLILTNTTLDRPETLPEAFRSERGGLSGRPLTDKSTVLIRNIYRMTGGKLPIIGAGGVSSAADAYAKIRAGASLVQLYSALVFHGPGLATRINTELAALLKADGFTRIQDAVGKDA